MGPGDAAEGERPSLSSALITDPANWEEGSIPQAAGPWGQNEGQRSPPSWLSPRGLKLACAGLVDTKGDQKA